MIDELRKKYPVFIYEGFDRKVKDGNLEIIFKFEIGSDIEFSPVLKIKNLPSKFSQLDDSVIDNFIFNLGLAEIASYWKTTCSPLIKIKAGNLKKEQIEWWCDLIMNGMGQFFYENRIDFTKKDFLKIESDGNNTFAPVVNIVGEKSLIPVGGGKDSSVTLEIFNKNYKDIAAFVLNPLPASLNAIKIAEIKNIIEVERKIDPKLLEFNQKGYLNGHTPISSVYAFISIFCAYIFGYKNIVFSNERSSSEGNVSYLGRKINHQYSKTLEFENKFREYNEKYLSNINYFSFLRPLYELQISNIFCRYPKYFSSIRSCNKGQKMGGIWCSLCPKCLSTFILLYPFLGKEEILRIFPVNLYENIALYDLLEDLILDDRVKPFECVGTREELKVGLYLSSKRGFDLPVLLQKIWDEYLSKEQNWDERSREVLNSWDSNNNLEERNMEILKKEMYE